MTCYAILSDLILHYIILYYIKASPFIFRARLLPLSCPALPCPSLPFPPCPRPLPPPPVAWELRPAHKPISFDRRSRFPHRDRPSLRCRTSIQAKVPRSSFLLGTSIGHQTENWARWPADRGPEQGETGRAPGRGVIGSILRVKGASDGKTSRAIFYS